MDDPGQIVVHSRADFDLKHNLREHPALKLMDMVGARDAAIAERDTALVGKKTAFAERESAFLQRDIAIADRNAAWMERDAAVMALSMVRAGKDNREVAAKLMQMVNMSFMGANLRGLTRAGQESDEQDKQPGIKASPKRRVTPSQNTELRSKSPLKKKWKQKAEQAKTDRSNGGDDVDEGKSHALALTPTPFCSCTGAHQQCYRWGKGGWQSACCTNFLSMYPLPMNPVKHKSSRVPGRKMSGSAFKKLLERLSADGVDISTSKIDLKNYWAKHGTNKYATIK